MLTASFHTLECTAHLPDESTTITYGLSNNGRFYQHDNATTITRETDNLQNLRVASYPVIFDHNPCKDPCSITITVVRTRLTRADDKTAAVRSLVFDDEDQAPFSAPLSSPRTPVRPTKTDLDTRQEETPTRPSAPTILHAKETFQFPISGSISITSNDDICNIRLEDF